MQSNKMNENFKSGFIAIMGRTNTGKSTLVNTILGQRIAAISPRPQTTRRRQLGIYTSDLVQMIFIDTPGLHQPKHLLGERMLREAKEALVDSDLILFMVDLSEAPGQEDRELADLIRQAGKVPDTLLVMNKMDQVSRQDQLQYQCDQYQKVLPDATGIVISALDSASVVKLVTEISNRLPEGPLYYPPDQVTDLYERDIAADLIRSAALAQLRDEIPHGIAVRIDEYTEREESGAYIRATLFVDRESHKGIVIGQKGSMLKSIGSLARQEIENMSARKVFLDLRVKVRKNWRNDEKSLRSFGFKSQNSRPTKDR